LWTCAATRPARSRRSWGPLRWIVVAVVAAVLVLGFAAFLVVKPDREACKTAIGAEVDTMLANDKPIEQWEEPNADELRARVSWPCRFQSDAQLEAIGREVFSERFPEIMTAPSLRHSAASASIYRALSRPRERKKRPALGITGTIRSAGGSLSSRQNAGSRSGPRRRPTSPDNQEHLQKSHGA